MNARTKSPGASADRRRAPTIAGLTLALACGACAAPDTTRFAKLPAYAIDTFACEVTIQREDGAAIPVDAASEERVRIAQHLDRLMADRKVWNPRAARFKARIVDGSDPRGMSADLMFEIEGQLWTGRGYGRSPTEAVVSALGNALESTPQSDKK